MSVVGWLASNVLPRGVALSVALHAGIVATIRLAPSAHGPAPAAADEIPIETAEEVPVKEKVAPPVREAEPENATPPMHPTHHHPYPVPITHDAVPHDPAAPHAVATATEPASEPAAPEPVVVAPSSPARFTIPVVAPMGVAAPPAAGASPAIEAPLPEAQVSVPAKLLGSVASSYPPDARSAEIEADVPLEIVVDAAGAVVEARVTTRAGYGFDEAATSAVRRYRFSPALREGRAVRVRMRWAVQFRLR